MQCYIRTISLKVRNIGLEVIRSYVGLITRMDPTDRPIPITGPILHISLIIRRRTITWAEISAVTSQKTKLPSHKVNSASCICFSL